MVLSPTAPGTGFWFWGLHPYVTLDVQHLQGVRPWLACKGIPYSLLLVIYPNAGLGSYSRIVGCPKQGAWYEPTVPTGRVPELLLFLGLRAPEALSYRVGAIVWGI